MESFKLVLPSNASNDHFPKNNPAHYQTRLHNPIQLDGKWEVAAESIYYSSNIEIKEESAVLDLTTEHKEEVLVNDIYKWKFKMSPNKTWMGYKGVELPEVKSTFEFIDALNSLDLVNKTEPPLFSFTRDSNNNVIYRGSSPNFSIEISSPMAKALGFNRHHVTFTGLGPYKSEVACKDEPIKSKQLVYFFHSFLVQQEKLITLKYPGERCTRRRLLTLWNERVRPYTETNMEFTKHGKVILHHLTNDKAIIFSPELGDAIDHYKPLIHRQTRWSFRYFDFPRRMIKKHWFLEIYNMKMQTVIQKHSQHVSLNFQPRSFSTVDHMITFINEKVISMLKAKLKDNFHAEKHAFSLTRKDSRVSINLGTWLQLSCSRNVSLMLGFEEVNFNAGKHEGIFIPHDSRSRVQRVLLMTDVIESISYGNHRLQILQDFVHNIHGRGDIIEKRFQPLSFVPLKRNYIDTISIQLVNEYHQQITATDVKTVVILHFQRLKQ